MPVFKPGAMWLTRIPRNAAGQEELGLHWTYIVFAANDQGFIFEGNIPACSNCLLIAVAPLCFCMFLCVSFAAVQLELVHLRSSDVAHYLPLDHTFSVCVGVRLRQ